MTVYDDQSHLIIKAYYEVYSHTARNLPEYLYERAMRYEIEQLGLSVQQQPDYEISYKDKIVGRQRLDLFVADDLVVELKATEELTKRHKAQAISYIKTVDKLSGLLFNFGSAKPQFHRLHFNPDKRPKARSPNVPWPGDWYAPELSYEIINGLYEIHHLLGAGFVYRIYANACYHEMQLRGYQVETRRRMPVTYKNKVLGDVAFAHLLVEGQVMLLPVAIRQLDDLKLAPLKAYLQIENVPLAIVANFDAVRLEVMSVRAEG